MIEVRVDELFAKFSLIDCIFEPLTRFDMQEKILLFWTFQTFHPEFFWKVRDILERRVEIAEKILAGEEDEIFEIIGKVKLPKNWRAVVEEKRKFLEDISLEKIKEACIKVYGAFPEKIYIFLCVKPYIPGYSDTGGSAYGKRIVALQFTPWSTKKRTIKVLAHEIAHLCGNITGFESEFPWYVYEKVANIVEFMVTGEEIEPYYAEREESRKVVEIYKKWDGKEPFIEFLRKML